MKENQDPVTLALERAAKRASRVAEMNAARMDEEAEEDIEDQPRRDRPTIYTNSPIKQMMITSLRDLVKLFSLL